MDVTTDYFTSGRDWQRYMAHFVDEMPDLQERIELGVNVERIVSDAPCVYIKGGGILCD